MIGRLVQYGRVEGRALTPSRESTGITTNCWTIINRKTLELTKKDTLHPKTKEKPHWDVFLLLLWKSRFTDILTPSFLEVLHPRFLTVDGNKAKDFYSIRRDIIIHIHARDLVGNVRCRTNANQQGQLLFTPVHKHDSRTRPRGAGSLKLQWNLESQYFVGNCHILIYWLQF